MKNTMKPPSKIKSIIIKPWVHLVFLAGLLIFVYSQSTIVLMDDNVFYQAFTEKLVNHGQIDFSIPGFHGGDFLTAPVYFLTRSINAVAYSEMLLAILAIFTVYLAVKEIYHNRTWGVIAAYIFLLMPFDYALPLRGHHNISIIFLATLGLYLLFKNSRFTWLVFGLSYITRPFTIALAPLFIYQRKFKQFFLSLIIPVVYVAAEYWQIGRIQMGVHENLTPESLFSIKRFFLNLAYAGQNYFSFHNYSFLNCLDTYDMVHLSPFITFLALLGFLYYKKYHSDLRLFFALLVSAGIALAIPAAFVHLDMGYLLIFNLCLILLAVPVITSHRLWLPIVSASFFFQFLYAYLSYRNVYWHNYAVFAVPILIFIISLIYAFMSKDKDQNGQPKVLIATGIYPPDIGGPASIIAPLAESLRGEGFSVEVITYSTAAPIENEQNVQRIIKDRWLSRLEYFFMMLMSSFDADLIYVTDTYSVGYFAYLIKKLTCKKYIVRFAGDSAWETAVGSGWTDDYIVDFQKKTYIPKIEKMKDRRRKILTGADKVITVSKFMEDLAIMIGVKPEKIQVIYNSLKSASQPANSGISGIDWLLEGKVIMTACRLTRWKGVDPLIKALPEIILAAGPVSLAILGDGPELLNLKKLVASLGLTNQVEFLGRIPHESVLNYYRQADVFVLNTNYEGLSHTLLEVMSAGRPIVATNVGGNPEVIENGVSGLLVDYGNGEQLKTAVVKILQNSDLAQELSNEATKRLAGFTWAKTISETAALMKSVL